MAVNTYFNNYSNSMEQDLIESLITESIKIHGIDIYYLPRRITDYDKVFHEDTLSYYDSNFLVEMYIKTFDQMGGEGDLLQKFGLTIRDSMTLTVSIRRFNETVGGYSNLIRPREGDLIFFPLNNKIFQVMHVEHESLFYQMGSLQVYDLKVELYEYSNERFNTGIQFIDNMFKKYDTTNTSTIEELAAIDPIADNLSFEEEASEFLDFSETNPFGDNRY